MDETYTGDKEGNRGRSYLTPFQIVGLLSLYQIVGRCSLTVLDHRPCQVRYRQPARCD